MKYIDNLFLTDDEIRILAIFLAYGVGMGVLVGMFFGKIELFFALGGVISVLISLSKIGLERIKKSDGININKL